jgi:hypothetical protein
VNLEFVDMQTFLIGEDDKAVLETVGMWTWEMGFSEMCIESGIVRKPLVRPIQLIADGTQEMILAHVVAEFVVCEVARGIRLLTKFADWMSVGFMSSKSSFVAIDCLLN